MELIFPIAAVSSFLHYLKPDMSLGLLDKMTLATYDIQKAVYQFSCGKAKDILGYKPMYSQEEALTRSFAQYKAAGVGIFGKK